MNLARRRFLSLGGAAVAASAVSSSPAWPQAYPNKPIRFIVPLAAGGGTDFLARLVGEYLSGTRGHEVLVQAGGFEDRRRDVNDMAKL